LQAAQVGKYLGRFYPAGVTDKNERLAQELLRHKTKTTTKQYTKIVLDQLLNEIKEKSKCKKRQSLLLYQVVEEMAAGKCRYDITEE